MPARPSYNAKGAIKGASSSSSANANTSSKSSRYTNNEQGLILQSYFENQGKTDGRTQDSKADVLLICSDGIIPAHGVILQSISPFFEKMFEAQGPFIIGFREVLLPDFSIDIMRSVVRLIYDEKVYLKDDLEVERVKEAIKCLQISMEQKLSSVRAKKPSNSEGNGDVVCYSMSSKSDLLAGRAILIRSNVGKVKAKGADISVKLQSVEPPETNTPDEEMKDVASEISDSAKTPTINDATPAKTSPQLRRTTRKAAAVAIASVTGVNESSRDNSPESGRDESDSDFDSDEGSASVKSNGKRGRATKRRHSNSSRTTTNSSTSTAGGVSLKPLSISLKKISPSKITKGKAAAAAMPAPQPLKKDKKAKDEKDSSTDKEIDESNYKDQVWFATQAKKCQKCKHVYDTAAEATQCLSGHSRLRCYFCFRICQNTEQLFQHFQRAHKKAGRENFLMCPFCEQSIPFKSVSCHVISMHLSESGTKGKDGKGTVGRPARQYQYNNNNSNASRNSTEPASKKVKLAEDTSELRVGDLHCVIRHVKKNGKTRVYNLTKLRPTAPPVRVR